MLDICPPRNYGDCGSFGKYKFSFAGLIELWVNNSGGNFELNELLVIRPTTAKGDPYDAHHIIEQNYGGPHEWWNMHPARAPDQHQGGIHGAGSPARELFK